MLKIISNKTIDCTSCGKPVKVRKLRPVGATKYFPNGAYEGRCPHCGAIFEYDANYIKSIL